MSSHLLPLLLAGVQVPAHDLAALSLAECRRLHGTEVVVYFAIGAPPMAHDGVTYFGPGDLPDGSERCVVLAGEDRGFQIGDRVGVRGTLEVIRWPASIVNGVHVPAWVSVRVTGAAVTPSRLP